MTSAHFAGLFIISSCCLGLAAAAYFYSQVAKVRIPGEGTGERESLNGKNASVNKAVAQIYKLIQRGAKTFLFAEYRIMAIFMVIFGLIIFLFIGSAGNCGPQLKDSAGVFRRSPGSCWTRGGLTTLSFLIGSVTSIISGYIGMMVAVFANARTALQARDGLDDSHNGWFEGFMTAYRAGAVLGFSLCSLGLLVMYLTILAFNSVLPFDGPVGNTEALFECVAGFGLGGSAIAMFGRVGGGIYTKAADVGADLVGKTEWGLDEDDPRNCATIADNVGDNVGDVAGMGADLFGSFAESSSAALVVASVSSLQGSWGQLMFPLMISAAGILVGIVTAVVGNVGSLKVRDEQTVFPNLRNQLIISTVLITPVIMALGYSVLPHSFCVKFESDGGACAHTATWSGAVLCVIAGTWGGLLIGLVTYYYTGYEYRPTQEVAESTRTGAATNIIYGLALGYQSTIVPILTLSAIVFVAFTAGGMYGVALSALGMLSTLSICLSIDVYGPITDNAGGIAEMAMMPETVRQKTDVFDAAGNTTAAIGKGFAIGSAALVSLALFGAFVTRSSVNSTELLHPITFSGLMAGAMLPYWFSAMTMKSVGIAAMEMVKTVRNQFKKHKFNLFYVDEATGDIMRGEDGSALLRGPYDDQGQKDPLYRNPLELEGYYAQPVKVSTDASLKMMIAPGALVMFSPILIGFFFGVNGVVGLLAGSLVSGVQMAISSSNTGGAWDNAKKYVEKGMLALNDNNDPVSSAEFPQHVQKKGGECHKAAVIGDTVGDPLKDTSGPALNILMKLMAIISLVFAPFITQHSICSTLHTC